MDITTATMSKCERFVVTRVNAGIYECNYGGKSVTVQLVDPDKPGDWITVVEVRGTLDYDMDFSTKRAAVARARMLLGVPA